MSILTKSMKPGFWKLSLCAALLALLAGCGDDQSEEQPPAPEDSEMTATEPAAETQTDASDDAAADTSGEADAAGSDDDQAADNGGNERHTVQARATAFDPVAIRIKPGDTVSWTNMSGHNVHFEAGNIPEQAETYRSSLGDNVSRTFDVEGVYLYKCDPHFAMGMVGAIIVGEPTNLEAVEENAKGMYKRALAKAKQEIE